jgi:hypothetical protein
MALAVEGTIAEARQTATARTVRSPNPSSLAVRIGHLQGIGLTLPRHLALATEAARHLARGG